MCFVHDRPRRVDEKFVVVLCRRCLVVCILLTVMALPEPRSRFRSSPQHSVLLQLRRLALERSIVLRSCYQLEVRTAALPRNLT